LNNLPKKKTGNYQRFWSKWFKTIDN